MLILSYLIYFVLSSSAELEQWHAAARSVPKDDPFFLTIEPLLDDTGENM
jgi:hypothetical protein